MNAKKSNAFSYWKYAFVAPVLFGLLLLLNEPLLLAGEIQPSNLALPAENTLSTEQVTVPERALSLPVVAQTQESNDADIINNCAKLTKAIRENDLNKIKELLQTVDPNCVDPNPAYEEIYVDGHRFIQEQAAMPFHAAARQGWIEAADLLLTAGAKLEAYAEGDGTPLLAAAAYGQLPFVQYLQQKGANLKRVFPNHGSVLTVAANEGHTEMVSYLLDQEMEVDASYPNQGTPLIAAANNGHTATVKLLLDRGAKVDKHSPNQGTALIAAANNGHVATVQLLKERGANINLDSPNHGTALVAAANNGHVNTVAYLLENGADLMRSRAVSAAANNGHTETIKLLTGNNQHVQLNLHINRHEDQLESMEVELEHLDEELDLLELLADADVHIDVHEGEDDYGLGMIQAANNGHNETIAYFLEQGVNIDYRTSDDGTALIAAANNGETSTCRFLIEQGATIDLLTYNQGTALIAAANNCLLYTSPSPRD